MRLLTCGLTASHTPGNASTLKGRDMELVLPGTTLLRRLCRPGFLFGR